MQCSMTVSQVPGKVLWAANIHEIGRYWPLTKWSRTFLTHSSHIADEFLANSHWFKFSFLQWFILQNNSLAMIYLATSMISGFKDPGTFAIWASHRLGTLKYQCKCNVLLLTIILILHRDAESEYTLTLLSKINLHWKLVIPRNSSSWLHRMIWC